MGLDESNYGHWSLVMLYAGFVTLYAWSFLKPHTSRRWLGFLAFSAFVTVVYVEQFGEALTHDALTEWLQSQYGRPVLLSYVGLGSGFYLLSLASGVREQAQRKHVLATMGPYARIRHPQYVAMAMILLGFLVQWPSLTTLLMFPAVLCLFRWLAISEEVALHAEFGTAFEHYAEQTPRFIPRFKLPTGGALTK